LERRAPIGNAVRARRAAAVNRARCCREQPGADGAYFRVHHFANQLASPFPLLAAVGARTSRIEIGTGIIDMRYEYPELGEVLRRGQTVVDAG